MGCVAGPAEQLSSLLQAGLRHVTHASLDPFRFDQTVRMMNVEGDSACATALTLHTRTFSDCATS